MNAQKMGEHEAEIEKIKNVFLAILRDIKKDIDNGEQPGEAVTARDVPSHCGTHWRNRSKTRFPLTM